MNRPSRQKSNSDSIQLQWGCMWCSWQRWVQELTILRHRWWLAITILLTEYIHMIVKNIAYFRHDPLGPLKDLGFDLISPIDEEMDWVGEACTATLIFSSLAIFILPCFIKNSKYYFFTIGARWAIVTSITTWLRCCTFLATSVPGPHYHCHGDANDYDPPSNWSQIYETKRLNFVSGCGDLIFSGHTLLILSFFLSVKDNLKKILLFDETKVLVNDSHYNRRDINKKLIKYYKRLYYFIIYGFFLPLVCVILFLIIAARKHYTIDVLLGIYITPMVHHWSYSLLDDDPLKAFPKCCFENNGRNISNSKEERSLSETDSGNDNLNLNNVVNLNRNLNLNLQINSMNNLNNMNMNDVKTMTGQNNIVVSGRNGYGVGSSHNHNNKGNVGEIENKNTKKQDTGIVLLDNETGDSNGTALANTNPYGSESRSLILRK